MKSIKEKAEEYAFIKQGIDPVGIQFREFDTNKQDGFEAGANYVLEHLSMTISVSDDGYLRDNLRKMIEQLKK